MRALPRTSWRPLARAWLALLLAGCAAVAWPVSRRDPAAATDRLLDLRGVVHVHTRGSHDSPGSLASVVEAARHAGLSWVALTEHPEPGRLEAWGRIDGVSVLPGFELRAQRGSILALGITRLPPARLEPRELVRWIHAAGGLAILGHIERTRLVERAAFERAGLDGIELANLHPALEERRLRVGLRLLVMPTTRALRPLLRAPRANLARWEALPAANTIVGSVDAHARFRVLGPLGGTIDRYRDIFRLLTTHVLAPDREPGSILAALRAGRSYVAFEGLAPVSSFRFERAGPLWRLEAPRRARLALVCDGEEVASLEAEIAQLAAPSGALRCRGEAWLGSRLWVVTSYRSAATP